MTTLLAIDTSMAACSVALLSESQAVERTEPMMRGHAERLIPMINEVMAETGTGFVDLDLVAATVGPGTFTGLRIGLASARGVAVAAKLPCYGVCSFAALVASLPREAIAGRLLLATIESRPDEVYVQAFRSLTEPVSEALTLKWDEVATLVPPGEPAIVLGEPGADVAACLRAAGIDATAASLDYPSPLAVARQALAEWEKGVRPKGSPMPVYLRPPATTPPRQPEPPPEPYWPYGFPGA